MRVQKKIIHDIVEDIFKYSIQVAKMKFCDYEKVKRIIARKEFLKVKYDNFSCLSNDDIKELIATLKNKENRIRIKEINKNINFEFEEFSFYSSLLEELEYPLFFEFKQSIELFIKKTDIQHYIIEKAEKVSLSDDIESILYLFRKMGDSKYYSAFLMQLYGACLYLNPKILEQKRLKRFYSKYVNNYWERKLSRTMCGIEKQAIKYIKLNNSEKQMRLAHDINFCRDSFKIKLSKLFEVSDIVKKKLIEGVDSAVEENIIKSNGKIIISSYTINKNSDIENVTAILNKHKTTLFLDKDIILKEITIGLVFFLILKIALGYYCVYCDSVSLLKARLRAWKSIAGLAGLDLNNGNEYINESLSQCKWYIVKPDFDWFYEDMGSIWLICINKNTNLITMLCATDAD